jgi:hypothetical protein
MFTSSARKWKQIPEPGEQPIVALTSANVAAAWAGTSSDNRSKSEPSAETYAQGDLVGTGLFAGGGCVRTPSKKAPRPILLTQRRRCLRRRHSGEAVTEGPLGLAGHRRARRRPRLGEPDLGALRSKVLQHFVFIVTPAALESPVVRRDDSSRSSRLTPIVRATALVRSPAFRASKAKKPF